MIAPALMLANGPSAAKVGRGGAPPPRCRIALEMSARPANK